MIRRAVVTIAALAAAAIGVAGASCSAILGVDADPKMVIDQMCVCDELRFLGDREACKATLRAPSSSAHVGRR